MLARHPDPTPTWIRDGNPYLLDDLYPCDASRCALSHNLRHSVTPLADEMGVSQVSIVFAAARQHHIEYCEPANIIFSALVKQWPGVPTIAPMDPEKLKHRNIFPLTPGSSMFPENGKGSVINIAIVNLLVSDILNLNSYQNPVVIQDIDLPLAKLR